MKIEFFFTEGHKHTATNVFDIVIGVDAITYQRDANTDLEGIETIQTTTVSTDDMLYAVIHRASGVQIVPGIFSKFEVVPVGPEVVKQNNIEREARNLENRRVLRKVKKDLKNKENYAARNEKRRLAFLAEAEKNYRDLAEQYEAGGSDPLLNPAPNAREKHLAKQNKLSK